ncbi:YndJ family protein [Bacillus ndiopicus]|uniref:YndJ family protein n=1 Tax=Bacillus ndiopicus TaxID=1347368 RepID=UPI0005A856DC|nr:YndJ family protein [Bacillus ndiopicus]
MLGNLRRSINPLSLLGIFLLVIVAMLADMADFFFYLTLAQLVFVPIIVQCIVRLTKVEQGILGIGLLSVAILAFTTHQVIIIVTATLYLLATAMISLIGLRRFLQLGFINTAEIAIDIGLIYLVIGGMWFFAYSVGIDTGFSPLITWLTAIHFHYSAFLLCISVGLLGRTTKSSLYKPVVAVIISGPIMMAIGITLSTVIEMVSAILYITAIYLLFFITMRTKFPYVQAIFIRLSIAAICFSIFWSVLYAYGNFTGRVIVEIPDMLRFHGFVNCYVFGVFTVLAWMLYIPATKQQPFQFPVSQIRGRLKEEGAAHAGLVESLDDFVDTTKLHSAIPHFYEQTDAYRLFAQVHWQRWFLPFAFIYKALSRWTQQINLPLSKGKTEMTGKIVLVDEQMDGREYPRAWIRTIKNRRVFTAIYSKHSSDKTYMNIALPLPFSTMVGVLSLYEENGQLHLTSRNGIDAGIYLAIGSFICKLPLQEQFTIEAISASYLTASHKMTLFGLKFLEIHYEIEVWEKCQSVD